jgi:hypothetical protein
MQSLKQRLSLIRVVIRSFTLGNMKRDKAVIEAESLILEVIGKIIKVNNREVLQEVGNNRHRDSH